jgi:maltose-binding protein MalE
VQRARIAEWGGEGSIGMVAGHRVAGERAEPLSAVLAERAMNRRDFLRMGGAGLAGVGLLGVGACGGGGTSGTLRWSMWSDTPEETKVWKDLAKDVHEKYPDITVKLETVTFADYWDKLTTQIASENEADIVAMQSLRMPGYAARRSSTANALYRGRLGLRCR